MKNVSLGRILMTATLAANLFSTMAKSEVATIQTDKYKVNLFFSDSALYEDELTLVYQDGQISGNMHVPNDFDAPLENPTIDVNNRLTFHITLPPKYDQMFPGGLFYSLQFRQLFLCEPRPFCLGEFIRVTTDFMGTVYTSQRGPRRDGFVGYVLGFKKAEAP